MRLIIAVFALIALSCNCAAGDFWKVTSRGHRSVWAVTKTCPCGDSCPCPAGSCANGQCATKPLPQALPDAPVQSGTVIYSSGSCSSGSCGGAQSYSRGIFGRRR